MPQKSPSTWLAAFELDGQTEHHTPDFELEIVAPRRDLDAAQGELYLPAANPEQPADNPLLPLSDDMQPPYYDLPVCADLSASSQAAPFKQESLQV